MDQHYRTTPLEHNLPVLLAMVGIWNINILRFKAQTILPNDGRLKILPNYLSQLEMESNGKTVTSDGSQTSLDTSPSSGAMWGPMPSTLIFNYCTRVPQLFMQTILYPLDAHLQMATANPPKLSCNVSKRLIWPIA
jgi:glucose-6-phosphate isomerase